MVDIDTFSTADIDAGRKLSYWNDRASACFLPLVCDPGDPQTFEGRIARLEVGGHVIAQVDAADQTVRHTKAHIGRTSEARFFVHLQAAGRTGVRHHGRETQLAQGEFTLIDGTRPYELDILGHNRMILFAVPVDGLKARVAHAEDLVGRRFDGNRRGAGLFARVLADYWSALGDGLTPLAAERLSGAVFDLLAVACAGSDEPGAVERSAAHRHRIINFIEAHLTDPDLTPETIARACGVSKRYVHVLMARQHETVGQYIQRRRLEASARELRSALGARRSISTIAYAHGFETHAHFSRAFRAHFGMTPADYRRLPSTPIAPAGRSSPEKNLK